MLAALTIPNEPAPLARLDRDPQHAKPGATDARPRRSTAAQVDAVAAYLESLR